MYRYSSCFALLWPFCNFCNITFQFCDGRSFNYIDLIQSPNFLRNGRVIHTVRNFKQCVGKKKDIDIWQNTKYIILCCCCCCYWCVCVWVGAKILCHPLVTSSADKFRCSPLLTSPKQVANILYTLLCCEFEKNIYDFCT